MPNSGSKERLIFPDYQATQYDQFFSRGIALAGISFYQTRHVDLGNCVVGQTQDPTKRRGLSYLSSVGGVVLETTHKTKKLRAFLPLGYGFLADPKVLTAPSAFEQMPDDQFDALLLGVTALSIPEGSLDIPNPEILDLRFRNRSAASRVGGFYAIKKGIGLGEIIELHRTKGTAIRLANPKSFIDDLRKSPALPSMEYVHDLISPAQGNDTSSPVSPPAQELSETDRMMENFLNPDRWDSL